MSPAQDKLFKLYPACDGFQCPYAEPHVGSIQTARKRAIELRNKLQPILNRTCVVSSSAMGTLEKNSTGLNPL